MSISAGKISSKEPRQRRFIKNILRKIFLDDWLLKLLALAITLGLWLGVTGLTTRSTKRLTVQLVTNVANNVKITNTPDAEIDIVVSGDERKIKQMSGANLVASLDLSDVPPGDRIVSLSPENVYVSGLPEGIKLDEVPTRRIAVRIELVEEVDLTVVADLQGKPAAGFEVYGESVITPQRIRVRGPVSSLRSIESLTTDPIVLDGRKADFTERQVRVKFPADVMASDTVVSVSVRIGEDRVEKTLTVPVAGAAGKKAVLTLYGPKSVLDTIRPETIKVEMLKTDGGQDIPHAALPADLQETVEVKRIKLAG